MTKKKEVTKKFIIKVIRHYKTKGKVDQDVDEEIMAIHFMMPFTELLFDINKEKIGVIKKKLMVHVEKFWETYFL